MKFKNLVCLTYALFACFATVIKANKTIEKDLPVVTATPLSSETDSKHGRRQKRQQNLPYFPEYPEPQDFDAYDYPGPQPGFGPGFGPNFLVPAGIAGGTGLALKAVKTKAALKGLRLLAVPAGIAALGGIAALASGIIPPAVIGGINLPFQGKRRKRDVNKVVRVKIPGLYRRKLRKPQILRKSFLH